MRVRHRCNGAERTVELDSRLDGFTVADLAAALGGELDGAGDTGEAMGVSVDGCWHGPDTPLTSVQIWEGALLEAVPFGQAPSRLRKDAGSVPGATQLGSPDGGSVPGATRLGSPDGGSVPSSRPAEAAAAGSRRAWTLAVTGGLRAGSVIVPPATGSWVLGRAGSCDVVLDDPAVSRRHARVAAAAGGGRPVIGDLGSRNGTIIEGRAFREPVPVPAGATVRVGATCLQWRVAVDDMPAAVRAGLGAAAGRIPFNRPPRRRPRMAPAPQRVPAEPPPRNDPEPLSWAGIVLPVVAGLVMALVWSPFMAVFAALGPLVAIGTWLERRRRATRKHRQACRAVAEGVGRLVVGLPAARAVERRRRVSLVPDLAELVRRAETPSVRCWERRLDDPDAMRLGVGTADVPYAPPLEVNGDGPAAAEALAALNSLGPLVGVPVAVSLMPGDVVGVVGTLSVARSVARALVLQAAVLHGPADLAVAGLVPGGGADWAWMRWLPHTAEVSGGGSGALVATDADAMAAVAEAMAAETSPRVRLVVIDGTAPLTGRTAAGRMLLNLNQAAGIVVVADACDLPAACTTMVEVGHDAGGLRLVDPRSAAVMESVIAWGVMPATATDAAARLARLDDPEFGSASTDLPAAVALVDLVGGHPTADAVLRRWAASRGTADLSAPIGAAADGPLELDLVADGPHLLVGGTTGSGKSELLRSLVAGLAIAADPDHAAFVLVDYKGGAAFDRCADMPHVAGMVTDLDDRLAERALVCLEAELRHREERLRAVGAEDLVAFRARYRSLGSDADQPEPLPRLVVVVDEFATLAAELPEFLQSLVGIAQRGRSLGVHMVLATQRPAGVVTDDIRANTSCRIALRVTDRHDSNDVIGAPDAARISRQRPGRALARFGPNELIAFQSALVTGTTAPASAGVRVSPVGPQPQPPSGIRPSGEAGAVGERLIVPRDPQQRSRDCDGEADTGGERSGPPTDDRSDLDRVVDAVRAAHQRHGGRPPRSPWPAPLPAEIAAATLAAMVAPGEPAAWLVDDPARQSQFVGGWRPDDGHLVVIGGPASGTSTTLVAAALDLCRTRTPDDLHLYAIDLDAGLLSVLDGLCHTGAAVPPADGERRARLLRFLDDEIAARRAGPSLGSRPDIVLLVDDFAGLTRAHDPVRDTEPHERFVRIWSDGPAVGVRVAVSIGRAADLPPDLAAAAGVVLVHATSDASDGLRFGLRASTAGLGAGRAIRTDDGREVQVGHPGDGDVAGAVTALAATTAPTAGGPAPIGWLPPVVAADSLPVEAVATDRQIDIRFAQGDLTLESIGFALHDGEHALVLGPPRTGRTGALAAIAVAAQTGGVEVIVVADRPGDLAVRLGMEPVAVEVLHSVVDAAANARRLVFVDDADRIEDPDGVLARIAATRTGRCHLVVSTTADRLRSSYGHWLAEMRSCRTGVLLRPGPLDGDLLGAALPSRLVLPPLPGRCLIVADGAAAVAQVALAGSAA